MIKNTKKKSKQTRTFNPEGSGYDYAHAKKHGIKRGKDGKLPSVAPDGRILKGMKHKTMHKEKWASANTLRKIVKKGKYYYSDSLFKRKSTAKKPVKRKKK